jgi:hypothetical protein
MRRRHLVVPEGSADAKSATWITDRFNPDSNYATRIFKLLIGEPVL